MSALTQSDLSVKGQKHDRAFQDGYDLPEVVQPSADDANHAKMPVSPDSAPELAERQYPPHSPETQYAAYYAPIAPDPYSDKMPPQDPAAGRTILGLTRKAFFIVLGIILFIVILAIALGVGLGLGLNKSSGNHNGSSQAGNSTNGTNSTTSANATTPLEVLNRTSFASTLRGDGAGMLVYYQASNGSVMEAFVSNADLAQNSFSPIARNRQELPLQNFAQYSPIAATSYSANGSLWKHIFYTDPSGYVRLSNNSGKTPDVWQPGAVLSRVRTASGSIGLTSCYSDYRGSSLHVLFGDSSSLPIEYYNNFNGSGWKEGAHVVLATSQSGLACGVYNQNNAKRLVVYGRSRDNATLVHQARGINPEGVWIFVNETRLNADKSMWMDNNTDVAIAANADESVVYLYYRGLDHRLKQANLPGAGNGGVVSWNSLGEINDGTKINADWPSTGADGPVVLYQTLSSQIRASIINYNAVILQNIPLQQ